MPAGGQRVNHPNRTGYHDDVANACAGALWRVSQKSLHPSGEFFRNVAEMSRARAGAEWGGVGERAFLQRQRRMMSGY